MQHVKVDQLRVVLSVVVRQSPVGVAAHAMNARSGRQRLGHHVIVGEARHGAVVGHAGEDARAGHNRAERDVELLREVRRVRTAFGQNPS